MASVLSLIHAASGSLNILPVSVSLKHSYRDEKFWCFKEKSEGWARNAGKGRGRLLRLRMDGGRKGGCKETGGGLRYCTVSWK